MNNDIQRGKPYPLGATWEGDGANFAFFSENATKVVLCLYKDATNTDNVIEIKLPINTNHVHHGFVPHIKPGQLYGYRVYDSNGLAKETDLVTINH